MSELSTTTHTNSSDVSGYVTRINRLGAVVDCVFQSRIYRAKQSVHGFAMNNARALSCIGKT
jgi:hypothetical protein